MIRSQQERMSYLEIARNLRIIEAIFFVIILVYGFTVAFNYTIFNDSLLWVNDFNTLIIMRVALIIGSVLFSLIIRANFILYDEDPRSDKWFKTAIFGLIPGFTTIAIYLPSLYKYGAIGAPQWVSVALILIFFGTTSILLREQYSWEQSSSFVKIRLSAMLLGYIVFCINANIAFLLSFLFIGPILLIPFQPKVAK
jgi:hypothetical protein